MSRKRPKHKEHEHKTHEHEEHKEHEHMTEHKEHEKVSHEKYEKKTDKDTNKRKKSEENKFLKRVFGEDKKSLALVAAVFFVVGILVTFLAGFSGTGVDGMIVTKEEVGAKVVDYLNTNIVPPGSSATMVSIEEVNGLYTVTTMYQGSEIPVYATRDGTVLIVGTTYDMTQAVEPPPTQPDQPTEPVETAGVVESCDDADIVKTAKPVLMSWVVSMCPFGTQAMNGMYYVADHFGDDVDVVLKYITSVGGDGEPTAMHGADEHKENERQVCIRDEQSDLFWDYIHCYVESGNAASCEESTGIDSDALADCVENRGKEKMINEAAEWATVYQPAGGRGSPSFFLNSVKLNEYSFDQNGRSPNNLKNIACCAMETPVDGCTDQLYTANPPRGYGVISTDTTPSVPVSAGSC